MKFNFRHCEFIVRVVNLFCRLHTVTFPPSNIPVVHNASSRMPFFRHRRFGKPRVSYRGWYTGTVSLHSLLCSTPDADMVHRQEKFPGLPGVPVPGNMILCRYHTRQWEQPGATCSTLRSVNIHSWCATPFQQPLDHIGKRVTIILQEHKPLIHGWPDGDGLCR